MEQIKEKEYIQVIYRKLEIEEAETFWEMMEALDHETSYMMFEPGERSRNFSQLEECIAKAKTGTDFLLVAEIEGKIAGYILAQRGQFQRISHSAYIVTGIREAYRGMGIGTEFFRQLEVWALEEQLRRLELTVMCPNTMARHLYEKSGFRVEGVKKDSMYLDGKFVDEYYMAKIL